MSFFQNLFDEYDGSWSLSGEIGKGLALTFKVPSNKNKGEAFICWNGGPYDLSASGLLTFNFAYDSEFKNFASFTIDVTGVVPSATLPSEVRDILNSSPAFSDWYVAGLDGVSKGAPLNGPQRVFVRQKRPAGSFRTYVSNTGAELQLKFNKFGGVADIPSYFDKDSIANRFAGGANNKLIRLSHAISGNTVANPTVVTSVAHGLTTGNVVYLAGSNASPTINGQRTVTVTGPDTFTVPVNVTTAGTSGEWMSAAEKQIVDDAGQDYTTLMADWQHLRGRTNIFEFTKYGYDGSSRTTSKVVYPAGAKVGTMAKKTYFTYTGAATVPTTQLEVPYVLTTNDLLTP